MWQFVFPFQDGRVYHRMIGGRNILAAYKTFAESHWQPDFPAVGVWKDARLVAHVLPTLKPETDKLEPQVRKIL